MNRRKFLHQTAWSMPALLWLPSVLASCKKTSVDDLQYNGKVLIIGAGAAGLYAAQILLDQGAQVTILEASNRIGGRIHTNTDFSDFPIELGAEEIHGENSILHEAALAAGATFLSDQLEDYYYFNGSLKSESNATENTLFNAMLQSIDDIVNYTGGDTTAAAYGEISNISDNVVHIFNALVGNEHGTDNTRVGMHGLRTEAERWTAGDQNKMMRNTSMFEVLAHACPKALSAVLTEKAVQRIDLTGNDVEVTTLDGSIFRADAVICAVPITQLKNNSIEFIPPLPTAKTTAIQKIGMGRGMKIILQFNQRIWPSNMSSVYGKRNIPIFWVTSADGRSDAFILTGFVNGASAEYLFGLGEEGIILQALDELDELFGEATTAFISAIVHDWGSVPYIEGTYSYPTPDMGNAIDILAQPVGTRLFFAGEASHTGGHTSTVHGAMETGLRAAIEILQSNRDE
jgi:monoamine oxidase